LLALLFDIGMVWCFQQENRALAILRDVFIANVPVGFVSFLKFAECFYLIVNLTFTCAL